MKLEPVFLVAPDAPKPRRRSLARSAALFGWALAFVIGTLAGIGVAGAGHHVSTPEERLVWALDLQRADLDELVAHHQSFCWVACEAADPRLTSGIRRLALATLRGDPSVTSHRKDVARRVALVIEAAPFNDDLKTLAVQLRDLR